MRKLAITVAVTLATLSGSATVASAAPETNIECGLHYEPVFFGEMVAAYWGNCTDRPALIDIYFDTSGGSDLTGQACVAANEDRLLGQPTPLWVRYRGVDTGKTC